MSHQSFPKANGSITDGYVLTYVLSDGYWAPRPSVNVNSLAGWQTVYDVDFSSQPTQSFGSNGDFTIDGKTWTVENFATATSIGIVNGTGLQLVCNTTSTDYLNGTRTALIIKSKIKQFFPTFDFSQHQVRLSAYYSHVANDNFENTALGIEDHTNPMSLSYAMLRGTDANGWAARLTQDNTSTSNSDNTNVTDDVIQFTFFSPTEVEVRSGVYSSGFPTQENTRSRRKWTLTNTKSPYANSDDISFFYSAINFAAPGGFTSTLIRLKVEVLHSLSLLGGTGPAGGDLSGSFPNPTVSKIQGRLVSPATPSNGSVLMYSDADSAWVPISRYTPADSNTIIHWKFDEGSSPFANSGNGSSLNLTTFSGTPAAVTGIFGKAIGFSGAILSTGNTTVNEPNATSLTVSAWVKARSYSGFATIINKAYRNNNSWSHPFVSIYLSLTSNGDGSWGPAITTTGGVLTQPTITGGFRIPLGEWTLLSYTYDGSNLRSYINGALALTTPIAGAIDYGTHGPWDIGGVSNAGVNQFWDGLIDDVRVENVVRSQAYFEAMYRNGVGLRND